MQHVLIFALYVCMYLCQSRLGPGASYASAACVSRGYMVCARAHAYRVVTWFVPARTRIAWLHGLCPRARVSRGYMVCAQAHAYCVVTWFVPARTRIAWLHGLCPSARVLRGYMVCARAHAYRVVTWFVRVSHGYMVCTRVHVAWLHHRYGYMVCLALALALPRVAGPASFNAVAFTSIIFILFSSQEPPSGGQ